MLQILLLLSEKQDEKRAAPSYRERTARIRFLISVQGFAQDILHVIEQVQTEPRFGGRIPAWNAPFWTDHIQRFNQKMQELDHEAHEFQKTYGHWLERPESDLYPMIHALRPFSLDPKWWQFDFRQIWKKKLDPPPPVPDSKSSPPPVPPVPTPEEKKVPTAVPDSKSIPPPIAPVPTPEEEKKKKTLILFYTSVVNAVGLFRTSQWRVREEVKPLRGVFGSNLRFPASDAKALLAEATERMTPEFKTLEAQAKAFETAYRRWPERPKQGWYPMIDEVLPWSTDPEWWRFDYESILKQDMGSIEGEKDDDKKKQHPIAIFFLGFTDEIRQPNLWLEWRKRDGTEQHIRFFAQKSVVEVEINGFETIQTDDPVLIQQDAVKWILKLPTEFRYIYFLNPNTIPVVSAAELLRYDDGTWISAFPTPKKLVEDLKQKYKAGVLEYMESFFEYRFQWHDENLVLSRQDAIEWSTVFLLGDNVKMDWVRNKAPNIPLFQWILGSTLPTPIQSKPHPLAIAFRDLNGEPIQWDLSSVHPCYQKDWNRWLVFVYQKQKLVDMKTDETGNPEGYVGKRIVDLENEEFWTRLDSEEASEMNLKQAMIVCRKLYGSPFLRGVVYLSRPWQSTLKAKSVDLAPLVTEDHMYRLQ